MTFIVLTVKARLLIAESILLLDMCTKFSRRRILLLDPVHVPFVDSTSIFKYRAYDLLSQSACLISLVTVVDSGMLVNDPVLVVSDQVRC